MLKALVDVLLSSCMLAIAIWKSQYRHLDFGVASASALRKFYFCPY